MEYSEYRFRRIVAEKTKPLEQMASYIHQNTDMKKLIQPLGKSVYANRWKIRKNMLSSLSFLTYRD